MFRFLTAPCLSFFFLATLQAAPEKSIHFAELHLQGGKILQDVTVRKVMPDGVSVIHSSGALTIPFEKLSPEDAKTLGISKAIVTRSPIAPINGDKLEMEEDRKWEAREKARQKAYRDEEKKKLLDSRKVDKDALEKEFARLASMKTLWVTDFNELEKILRVDQSFPNNAPYSFMPALESLAPGFISIFGKPDEERSGKQGTETIGYDGTWKQGEPYTARFFMYTDRLTNPTTGKKETLRIEFANDFYRRVHASPSGNTSR